MIEILKKAKIVKTRRNEIYDIIVNQGLVPEEFLIIEKKTAYIPGKNDISIEFSFQSNEEFNFVLTANLDDEFEFWGNYHPGEVLWKNSYEGRWYDFTSAFDSWLRALKIELEVEERWERLSSGIEKIEFTQIKDGEKFTFEFSIQQQYLIFCR